MAAVITLLLVFIMLTMSGMSSGQQCDAKHFREFDNNVAKLLTIGNSGRKFPENVDQLPKYCKY